MGLFIIRRKFISLFSILKNGGKYKYRKIIKKIYVTFLQSLSSLIPNKGVDVAKEEWDYLIIIDACRYDYFKDLNATKGIEGKLEKKISRGSCTIEWLKNNFDSRYDEIIYIAGDPFMDRHKKIRNWEPSEHFFKFELMESRLTLETFTKKLLEIRKKYPEKKIIIHYPNSEDLSGSFLIYDEVEFGGLNKKNLRDEYKKHLKLVLSEIKTVIKQLDGLIVISADHGQSMGEKSIYGHPQFLRFKELIEVPWLVINKRFK